MKFLLVLGIILIVSCFCALRLDIFPSTIEQKVLGQVSDGDMVMGIGFFAGLLCVIVSLLWWALL